MNRNSTILLLLTLLMGQFVLGQDKEPALAKVHYKFKHINDTTQKENYHDEGRVLYLGQYASYYTSYGPERATEQLRKQMEAPGFDGNLTIEGKGASSPDSYYSVPSKQLFQQVYSIAGDRYIIEEEFPILDWKIEEDSREIGGYVCQKATVRFKGRDYTAWFTAEIPFPSGPWKLQGLPGLILDARDSKEEVIFQYAGFDKMIDLGLLVELPAGAMKASKKEVDRKVKAYNDNPNAYLKARAQGGGAARMGSGSESPLGKLDPSKIKSLTVKKTGMQKSKVTNNPIELTQN